MKYFKYLYAIAAIALVSCSDPLDNDDWEYLSSSDRFNNIQWFYVNQIDSIVITLIRSIDVAFGYSWYTKKDGKFVYERGRNYTLCSQEKNIYDENKFRFTLWLGEYDDGTLASTKVDINIKNGNWIVTNLSDGLSYIEFNRKLTYEEEDIQLTGRWAKNLEIDSVVLVFEDRLKEYIYQKGTNNVLLYTDYGDYTIKRFKAIENGKIVSEMIYLMLLPKDRDIYDERPRAELTFNESRTIVNIAPITKRSSSIMDYITAGDYIKVE